MSIIQNLAIALRSFGGNMENLFSTIFSDDFWAEARSRTFAEIQCDRPDILPEEIEIPIILVMRKWCEMIFEIPYRNFPVGSEQNSCFPISEEQN